MDKYMGISEVKTAYDNPRIQHQVSATISMIEDGTLDVVATDSAVLEGSLEDGSLEDIGDLAAAFLAIFCSKYKMHGTVEYAVGSTSLIRTPESIGDDDGDMSYVIQLIWRPLH